MSFSPFDDSCLATCSSDATVSHVPFISQNIFQITYFISLYKLQ